MVDCDERTTEINAFARLVTAFIASYENKKNKEVFHVLKFYREYM